MRLFLPAILFLSGCASGPTNYTEAYRAALEARPGVAWPGPAAGREAVQRFAALYADLSVANVQARVRDTYATGAWFNDTLATKTGIEAIEKYLLRTAEGAEKVEAKINDVAVSGADVYVRWTMEIRTRSLAGGRPIVTEGMSQLRFDREGRIVLHQDFWNPATGIYQHLPVLGPVIRFVDGLIAGS
jgi:limonene-1,2-epoxide hydrolase